MTPQELVADVRELVSLPAAAMRVNELIDDPRSSAARLGEVITTDAALTARLLRVANSAFYGLASKVDTPARAVAVIGSARLRELVLATSAIDAFDRIPNEVASMEDFWRHNIYCALAAKWLAGKRGGISAETSFVAGLLHDIGRLIIFTKMPEEAQEALWLSMEGPGDPEHYEAEREALGFDHAQVGGELARLWQLPASLAEPIEWHHQPERAETHPVETGIVHIANSVAYFAELDSLDEINAPPVAAAAYEATGLSADLVEPAVREAQAQYEDVHEALFGAAA